MLSKIKINENYLSISKEEFEKINNSKISYIFGKNGSGKTTISREIKNQIKDVKIFIFNNDYISENIYINEYEEYENIISQDQNNKQKTYKAFLGKNIIEIQKSIEKDNEEINLIQKWFNDKKCKNPINDDEWCIKFESEFKKSKKRIDYLKKLKSWNEFKEDLEEKKEELNSLKDEEKFKSLIDCYNEIKKEEEEKFKIIQDYNKIYSEEMKSIKTIEVHRTANQNCENGKIEFLGWPYAKNEIEEWLKKYENKKSKLIELFKKKKEKIKDGINYFKRLSPEFKDSVSIKYIQKIDLVEEENKKDIINGKIFNYNNIGLEGWSINFKNKNKELDNWFESNKLSIILSNDLEEAKEKINKFENLNEKIIEKDKDKKREMEKGVINLNNDINYFFKMIFNEEFSWHFEFSSRKTREPQLELKSNKKDFSKLSEGEKKALALSYFLIDLKYNIEFNEKEFLIFIDDPFDSNDHFKYDNLPNIKIVEEQENIGLSSFLKHLENKNKKEGKLIITTHNIQVLSSFIMNLKDNENNNDRYDYFHKIKKYASFINVFSIKKDGSNYVVFEEINKDLFFPKENKLKEFFYCMWNKFVQEDNGKIDEKEIKIFILITAILTKLFDLDDRKKERGKIKSYIKVFNENQSINENDNLKKYINKIDKYNFNFSKEEVKSFFEKYSNKQYDPLIIDYLIIVKDRYENILNSKDKNKIRRIRHKNNYHSSPIGHLIEE